MSYRKAHYTFTVGSGLTTPSQWPQGSLHPHSSLRAHYTFTVASGLTTPSQWPQGSLHPHSGLMAHYTFTLASGLTTPSQLPQGSLHLHSGLKTLTIYSTPLCELLATPLPCSQRTKAKVSILDSDQLVDFDWILSSIIALCWWIKFIHSVAAPWH